MSFIEHCGTKKFVKKTVKICRTCTGKRIGTMQNNLGKFVLKFTWHACLILKFLLV